MTLSTFWKFETNIILKLNYVLLIIIAYSFIVQAQTHHSKILSPVSKDSLHIGSKYDYLCYYGSWDNDKIYRAQNFDLVILEPSNISTSQVLKLKKGHDGILGTNDDVTVIAYVSLGEDHLGNRKGNGSGPCYFNYDSSKVIYENKGYASWYVDDKDKNGLPDSNPNWGSYYVNAGDSLWWNYLKTNPTGTDNTLVVKNCDGLFLDTIDSASPWYPWPYRWTLVGMSNLIHWLRTTYPDKYLIANRGLFYFDSTLTNAYAHTIRPDIDADMFESYYHEGDRVNWAKKVNNEANKADGFKVIALDYFNPSDSYHINQQIKEVFSYGWGDYISSSSLNQIRYDVFHKHAIDTNPPTWNGSIGLSEAIAGDKSVTLKWGNLTDQSLPIKFDLYYSSQSPFDTSSAIKIRNIKANYDSASSRYIYKVDGLTNYTKYYFLIRAIDSLGNPEYNQTILNATPPKGTSSVLNIDGNFNDWANVPSLNQAPNPIEKSGDSPESNADYTNFWITNDSSYLYISYEVAGQISSAYFYHIFLDTDTTNQTGYVYNDSASVGAEFMVENSGLWSYTGTGGSNWGWSPVSNFKKSDSGARTEMQIPLNVLFKNTKNEILRLVFQVNKSVSPFDLMDIAPNDYSKQYYSYQIKNVTSVKNEKIQPVNFSLKQNYPNPFNGYTILNYSIPKKENVKFEVYNALGQKVSNLVNKIQEKGSYSIQFNSSELVSGIYFYRLQVGKKSLTRKMVLLK